MTHLSGETFDYVVVGGGLAGCVVAARLSEDPRVGVVLIEAGRDNDYEESYFATGAHAMWATDANWGFKTIPQRNLRGQRVDQPRGRLIGGSAAINVGSWSRGIAADYDRWPAAGATGWDWETASATYLSIETSERPESGGRGRHGPMVFENTPLVSGMTEAFRQACLETGIGQTEDHNGVHLEGFDRWETIFPRGRRRNSAEAYLAPARVRSNLKLITSATVTHVTMQDKRATGVVFERDGITESVGASAEVILCAGAFLSPRILMTSGIGPGEHLRSNSIVPIVDSPGVGANLIDHLATRFGWAASKPGGIAPVYPDAGDPKQRESWRHTGYGLLADNPNPCIAFVRSNKAMPLADIELLFHVNPPDSLRAGNDVSGFEFLVSHVDPRSRGYVRLASNDPHDLPLVDPAYLSDPDDLPALIGGIRRALNLARSPSLAPYTANCELSVNATDQEIISRIENHAASMFHPVGTARMGRKDDPDAVLDSQLRVIGTDGLRVVDASAMPSTIRGHTMAPVVLIAERACALIREQRE
jgi:choline dehydrogenase